MTPAAIPFRCGRCNCRPASPGSVSCAPCRKAVRTRNATDRADRLTFGWCAWLGCRRDAAAGRTMCRTHLRKANSSSKRVRRERLAAGRCGDCGGAAAGKRCDDCRHRIRAAVRLLQNARRLGGLCPRCGEPAADGCTLCGPCREKAAAGERRRRAKTKAGRGNRVVRGGT